MVDVKDGDIVKIFNERGIVLAGAYVTERLSMAEMDRWRRVYPESFEKKYDPVSGLCFDAWIEGGDE